MPPVIEIESLSKRYLIQERPGPEQAYQYTALRDVLARQFAKPARMLRRILGGPSPEAAPKSGGKVDFWALHDINLQVNQGDRVAIVGRNGAGKSTLLKILSRITEPTKGRVRIKGRVASLLEVGTGFHPELTGRENIYLNGSILGMTRNDIKARFNDIVEFADIGRFLDTPVKRYSSGMYVRLAFAVAAHVEPDVLLVDEVLAVGDAAFQKKCLDRMGHATQEGRTVLFVSHNMPAVTQLCDRGVWIHGGKVRSIGTSEEVVKEYLASGSENPSERSWQYPGDAPGDELVRLLGCRLKQRGDITSIVDINAPCQVEMDFEVLSARPNLVTGVTFSDAFNSVLFAHCDWRPNELGAGRFRKVVEVPAHTFAEGQINILIQLLYYEPFIRNVWAPDVLGFDAIDSSCETSIRGPVKGGWPGAVRLSLPWGDAQRLG
jgi:lipopolysaccharide transport system ATP-binding protein